MTQIEYTQLLRKVGDEDALQQAWLELQAHDPGLELQDVDPRLLIGRARFRILDQHRRRRRADSSSLESQLDVSSNEREPVVTAAIGNETKSEVLRALDMLSPTYREVAILLWLDGLTPEEVAVRTGLNRKTVYTRRRRAVQNLRASLATCNCE